MKTGDIVEIYQDPITKHLPEGKARLVQKQVATPTEQELGFEVWAVKFLGKPSDGGPEVVRRIKVSEKPTGVET